MQARSDEIEAAMQQLFTAYDLDESGEIARDEYIALEMRLCFENGELYSNEKYSAKLTLSDRDRNGFVDYEEFRGRQLSAFQEMGLNSKDILVALDKNVRMVLQERVKMGPRYNAQIRALLKRIFSLFDASGDSVLSPEEWIAAQKVVAAEVSDDLDEAWIDEAAFNAADTNGDGLVQECEFLEASFAMFEGTKKRTDALVSTLQRIVTHLEREKGSTKQDTGNLEVYVQDDDKPEFQPPHAAWQDEPTEWDRDRNLKAWKLKGEVSLPASLETEDEVAAILRLHLGLGVDMWVSVFFIGPPRDGVEGAHRPVTLLRGEKPGEGNVVQALDYLGKPNADARLFIKNIRQRPSRLVRQPRVYLEERDALLAKRTGQKWGLDWETQLVGDGTANPTMPWVISVGDSILIEVPKIDSDGGDTEYAFSSVVFMDKTDVLGKPLEENIEVKGKGKKVSKKAQAKANQMVDLTLVALKEGSCVFFVDVGWEDQEQKLCEVQRLTAPVAENTVARIGPIKVDVQKPSVAPPSKDKPSAPTMQWWNGQKWSSKKGPAKRKGKKK